MFVLAQEAPFPVPYARVASLVCLVLSPIERHCAPHLLSINKRGIAIAAIAAKMEKHHPTPTLSIRICSTAKPEADRVHRMRFADALTVAGQ